MIVAEFHRSGIHRFLQFFREAQAGGCSLSAASRAAQRSCTAWPSASGRQRRVILGSRVQELTGIRGCARSLAPEACRYQQPVRCDDRSRRTNTTGQTARSTDGTAGRSSQIISGQLHLAVCLDCAKQRRHTAGIQRAMVVISDWRSLNAGWRITNGIGRVTPRRLLALTSSRRARRRQRRATRRSLHRLDAMGNQSPPPQALARERSACRLGDMTLR